MEEMNVDLAVEETNTLEAEMPTDNPAVPRSKKPRALIIKATNQDFEEIKEFVKAKFPNVQILYVTTGPAASILRVTKSMPFGVMNPSEELFYSTE